MNHFFSLIDDDDDSFLKPILLHGFSGLLHLVFLFVILVSWICNMFRRDDSDYSHKQGLV